MTEIRIPIAATGAGSQPMETEGAGLDILQLPAGMDACVAPSLPEPEDVQALGDAKRLLSRLQRRMRGYQVDTPAMRVDSSSLDAANRDLVDQVLGEGEVSAVFSGDVRARIWRGEPEEAEQTEGELFETTTFDERLEQPISRRDLLRGNFPRAS